MNITNIKPDCEQFKKNNKEGEKHLARHRFLSKRLKKFWDKYSKDGIIKNKKLVEKVMKLQKEVDDENTKALKCFLRGRVVWQGFV